MVQTIVGQGIDQGAHDVWLTDQILEPAGTPFSGQHLMAHRLVVLGLPRGGYG